MNAIIEHLVVRADAHQAADEYQKGHHKWKGGACAVGCVRSLCLRPATGVMPGEH